MLITGRHEVPEGCPKFFYERDGARERLIDNGNSLPHRQHRMEQKTLAVLFLCTANSCRSQMAEGWAKHLWGDQYEFFSAGTQKTMVNPRAIQVMQEVGIDLSRHRSKTVEELPKRPMDVVFTVCSSAHESCPVFPGGRVVHVGFDDPPRLAESLVGSEEDQLDVYRRVRDEIRAFVNDLGSYFSPLEKRP